MSAEILTDCDRIEAELGRRAPLSDAARKHLDACPRCRALYAWMSETPALPPISAGLSRRIGRELTASLKPVKPLPSIEVSAFLFFVIFSGCAAALIAMMGLAGFHLMSTLQFLGIVAILAAGAVLFSLGLARQTAPGGRRRLPSEVAAAAFGAAVLAGIVLLFPWREAGAGIAQSWQCSLLELAIAAPAAALFWLLLRRRAVLSATATGASIGAMAGLLGVTVLQFGCVYQNAVHLLLWHWSVLGIATAAGALAGRIVRSF